MNLNEVSVMYYKTSDIQVVYCNYSMANDTNIRPWSNFNNMESGIKINIRVTY